MKKVFITFLLTFFALSQIEVKGQEILGGAGIVIGTSSVSTFGIGIRGDYRLNEVWGFVPNFNFWFNKKERLAKYGLTTLNFDAHYLFDVAESLKVYPLAGLNISFVSYKTDVNVPGVDSKNTSTYGGLNLGAGAEYAITDSFRGYGELKYVISNADQLVIALGVLFRFKE